MNEDPTDADALVASLEEKVRVYVDGTYSVAGLSREEFELVRNALLDHRLEKVRLEEQRRYFEERVTRATAQAMAYLAQGSVWRVRRRSGVDESQLADVSESRKKEIGLGVYVSVKKMTPKHAGNAYQVLVTDPSRVLPRADIDQLLAQYGSIRETPLARALKKQAWRRVTRRHHRIDAANEEKYRASLARRDELFDEWRDCEH